MIFTQLFGFTMGKRAKYGMEELGRIRHNQRVIFVPTVYEIKGGLAAILLDLRTVSNRLACSSRRDQPSLLRNY